MHAATPLPLTKHATIFSFFSELHEVFVYVVVIATRQFLFFLYIFSKQHEKGQNISF